MTMKTLLLGAAAGLVTVGAAQAADLPMTKAEPVEYVKVCSEFGEGFFYIPGTDTCLKISGEVRANYNFNDRNNRQTDVTAFSTEPRLKFDARTNTEYGILRSYIQINMPIGAGNNSSGWNLDKAYIQFGGLTAGFAHSFFGAYDNDYGNTIFANYYANVRTVNLLAYTATFGGGLSATLAIEDGRQHRNGLWDSTIPGDTVYGGQSIPDLVANLRYDGAWGEAQLSGAVHQIRYPDEAILGIGPSDAVPDADYGWAVGATIGYNLPWGSGSHIVLEGTYADGAGNYLNLGGLGNDSAFTTGPGNDSDTGHGWALTGEIALGVTPNLVVRAVGSYLDWTTGDLFPAGGNIGSATFNSDAKSWIVALNATYTVVPGLTIEPEVSYTHVHFDDPTGAPAGFDPNGDDENQWAGGVRLKRTF
jgi:hypothetical protein